MSELFNISASQDEAWWEMLGLSHDPFADHGPGFRFFPAQRKSVLAQLHHLARYSQLMLLVVGPLGSGKSLLRQALMASSGKQSTCCVAMSARACGTSASLLQRIAQQLSVSQASVPAIMSRVAEEGLSGHEVYLLVDDAEQLDGEAFSTLMELATGGPEGRVHVFLFGEDGLKSHLVDRSVADACHVLELHPYSRDESIAYLSQRLEAAGAGVDLFDEEALTRICQRSGGWPGRLNDLARAELIEQTSREPEPLASGQVPRPHRSLPWRAIAAGLCVGVAVLAAVTFYSAGSRKVPLASVESAAGSPVAADASGSGDGSSIEFSGKSEPLPLPLVGEAQPIMREPLAAQTNGERAMASLEGAQYEPPVPASSDEESTGFASPPVAVPVEPAQAEPVSERVAAAALPPSSPVEPEPEVRKPVPSATPVQKAPAMPSDWYLAQPADNYVLQVIGTRSEQVARDLVARHGDGYRYFRKALNGQPLYVVTYGSFVSRDQAVRVIAKLPTSLQAAKPWARKMRDVQREVRSAR